MTETGGATSLDLDAELERLVAKGLGAPLSADEAVRLDALAAADPRAAARAEQLVDAWMSAGLLDPSRVERARGPDLGRRGLIAAGAAAAVAAPLALWVASRPQSKLYQAPDNGPLKVALADGTRLVLSRGGRAEARFSAHARDLRLIAGEAYFDVAKDAARPFVVAVGDHRLTVLGTQFNVKQDPGGLQVDLVEGSLRVERAGAASAAVVLSPGQRYRAGQTPAVGPADVAATAAWIDGRLVFDDVTLRQVAVELDRQTGQSLGFASPRLADLRFSGVLRLDDSEDWRLGLEAALPIRMTRTAQGYAVARR
jgi:transmembrane sensor